MITDGAPASDACHMVGGGGEKHVNGFHLHDRRVKDSEIANDRMGVSVTKPPQCNVKGNANEGPVTHNMCTKSKDYGHVHALNATYERLSTKCSASKHNQ